MEVSVPRSFGVQDVSISVGVMVQFYTYRAIKENVSFHLLQVSTNNNT